MTVITSHHVSGARVAISGSRTHPQDDGGDVAPVGLTPAVTFKTLLMPARIPVPASELERSTESFGALGVFGRHGAVAFPDAGFSVSGFATGEDIRYVADLGMSSPALPVDDPIPMMGLAAAAAGAISAAAEKADVAAIPSAAHSTVAPTAFPRSNVAITPIDNEGEELALTPSGKFSNTLVARLAQEHPSVVLSITEQDGTIQVVARGGGDTPESRVQIRRLVERVAAEFGKSVGGLQLNGTPVMPTYRQGVLDGRRSR